MALDKAKPLINESETLHDGNIKRVIQEWYEFRDAHFNILELLKGFENLDKAFDELIGMRESSTKIPFTTTTKDKKHKVTVIHKLKGLPRSSNPLVGIIEYEDGTEYMATYSLTGVELSTPSDGDIIIPESFK